MRVLRIMLSILLITTLMLLIVAKILFDQQIYTMEFVDLFVVAIVAGIVFAKKSTSKTAYRSRDTPFKL